MPYVVAVIKTDQVYFWSIVQIVRPVFATDGAGAKVWEASYKPFGGIDVTLGGAIDLRFPGQWFQAESGLHQNWMRDYDPTTGRYIQADPLGLIDGSSVYGYALQSPYRYTDPTGEFVPIIPVLVGALIGGTIGYLESNCWQGAFYGALIGASTGVGVGALVKIGIIPVVAGAGAGAGSGALAQIMANEVSYFCNCRGQRKPLLGLLFSTEFLANTATSAFGGAAGGLVSDATSVVSIWAAGYPWRSAVGHGISGIVTVVAQPNLLIDLIWSD